MKHLSIAVLSNYTVQRKSFEGKPHIVAPVVILTVGVHHGSGGPILYLEEELKKFPLAWNGSPLPVLHPTTENGEPISCNSPEVIEANSVGRLFNVQFTDNKLKGEIWVDEAKVKALSPVVYNDLLAGKTIEVSTGLFSDDEEVTGNWNGETYESIARNIRPDHLALLPGQTGACSVADGCGVRANKKGGDMVFSKEQIIKLLTKSDPSFEDVRRKLQGEMNGMDVMSSEDNQNYKYHYVVATYQDHFIYAEESNNGVKLYKRAYNFDNNKVTLGEDITEVQENTSYVEVKNNKADKEESVMSVKKCCPEKVAALIGNTNNKWGEEDREFLEGLSAEVFAKIEAESLKGNAVGDPREDCKDKMNSNKSEVKTDDKTKTNAAQTFDEFVASAPAEFKEMLVSNMEEAKAKKAVLVKALAASGVFTETELQEKSIVELEKLSRISNANIDYSGRGGVSITDNASEDQTEVLEAPVMNFGKTN